MIKIIIVVLLFVALGNFCYFGMSYLQDNGYLNNLEKPTEIYSILMYEDITDLEYYNHIGHKFVHADDCTCKIF